MSDQIEAERKYALAPGQELPDLSAVGVAGPTKSFAMVATYYDALDLRLIRAWQVLRRRVGGADEGWHLKLPGGQANHRLEMHAPLESRRVPTKLRERVGEILHGAALVPVATLRTFRSETPLFSPDGAHLALVCVDEVTAKAGEDTSSWREAEVELVGGTSAVLDGVERIFTAAGIRRAEIGSKIARVLKDSLIEAAAERTVTAQSPAGDIIRDYLAAQIGVLQSREADVRADVPDAVHRCRIATRRLRSALKTFSGLYDKSVTKPLRDELRWHATELGAPRDAEVLKGRLLATLDEVPGELVPDAVRARITESLDRTHRLAHAELVATMDSERYQRLQLSLEQLLTHPPHSRKAERPAAEVLPGMLARSVALVDRLRERALAKPADLILWHDVRKAAKAARYGSEALVAAFGEEARTLVEGWKQVTEAFGDVQDSVVAQQAIGDLALAAIEDGLPWAPFDELQHREEKVRREALARGIDALGPALQRAMSAKLAPVSEARSSGESST